MTETDPCLPFSEYEEYFTYLDVMRDCAVTNMFSAGPYLSARFGLDKHEAREVILAWMKSSDKRHSEPE